MEITVQSLLDHATYLETKLGDGVVGAQELRLQAYLLRREQKRSLQENGE